jgi:nucleoside-diphosphate-sugar epimerase
MHVLVTGGAGYLGSTLVPLLLEAGHRVTVIDRFYFGSESLSGARAKYGSNLTLRRADVRQIGPGDLDGVEAVVDLAGISNDPSCEMDPGLTREVNFEAAVRVAQAAQTAGVGRLVFACSCSVYGHGDSQALGEDSPLNPVSLYAQCKAEAESRLLGLARETGFCITSLRLATLFGVSGRTRFDLAVNVMTKNAYVARQITVEGGGRQWRPLVHVTDVARVMLQVLEAPRDQVAGAVFNVGSDANNVRILNLAYRVRDNVPGTQIVMAPTDPDLRDYNVSFERVRRELGFEPKVSIDEGIQEVLRALKEGRVDPDERRNYTLRQYVFLAEVESTYQRLALDGRILSSPGETS